MRCPLSLVPRFLGRGRLRRGSLMACHISIIHTALLADPRAQGQGRPRPRPQHGTHRPALRRTGSRSLRLSRSLRRRHSRHGFRRWTGRHPPRRTRRLRRRPTRATRRAPHTRRSRSRRRVGLQRRRQMRRRSTATWTTRTRTTRRRARRGAGRTRTLSFARTIRWVWMGRTGAGAADAAALFCVWLLCASGPGSCFCFASCADRSPAFSFVVTPFPLSAIRASPGSRSPA